MSTLKKSLLIGAAVVGVAVTSMSFAHAMASQSAVYRTDHSESPVYIFFMDGETPPPGTSPTNPAEITLPGGGQFTFPTGLCFFPGQTADKHDSKGNMTAYSQSDFANMTNLPPLPPGEAIIDEDPTPITSDTGGDNPYNRNVNDYCRHNATSIEAVTKTDSGQVITATIPTGFTPGDTGNYVLEGALFFANLSQAGANTTLCLSKDTSACTTSSANGTSCVCSVGS